MLALNQYAVLDVENWTGEWVRHAEASDTAWPNLVRAAFVCLIVCLVVCRFSFAIITSW